MREIIDITLRYQTGLLEKKQLDLLERDLAHSIGSRLKDVDKSISLESVWLPSIVAIETACRFWLTVTIPKTRFRSCHREALLLAADNGFRAIQLVRELRGEWAARGGINIHHFRTDLVFQQRSSLVY